MEQLVARRAHNPKVAGSSPAPATTSPVHPRASGFSFAGSRLAGRNLVGARLERQDHGHRHGLWHHTRVGHAWLAVRWLRDATPSQARSAVHHKICQGRDALGHILTDTPSSTKHAFNRGKGRPSCSGAREGLQCPRRRRCPSRLHNCWCTQRTSAYSASPRPPRSSCH